MFSSVGKRKYLGYFIYNFKKTPLWRKIACRMENHLTVKETELYLISLTKRWGRGMVDNMKAY